MKSAGNRMTKIAEIVPLKFLSLTSLNHYHMCLAHLVLKNEAYRDFYRKMSDQGKYVMVDNGACEGEKMSYDDLIKVYELINPTEIILPDVLFNMDETLDRSRYFLENYDLSKYKIMAVPQGKNPIEWKRCCEKMLKMEKVDSIGIPKWLGDRVEECEMLVDSGKEIHLLGCNRNPSTIKKCIEVNSRVRGCDSAFAYLCSKAGVKVIDENTERPDETIDFLNDTLEKTSLFALMVDFEITAGVYDNSFEKGGLYK